MPTNSAVRRGARSRAPHPVAAPNPVADSPDVERQIHLADASDQLASELKYIRGESDASMLSQRLRTPTRWLSFAERVERILENPELAGTLAILGAYNKNPNQFGPLLLSERLFHLIKKVEDRSDVLAKMPALDRPAAQVRAHFGEASIKCKELADLLRQGPLPFVAIGEHREGWQDGFESMGFPFLQCPDNSSGIVTFDHLLDSASSSYARLACRIPRAKQHRRPAKKKSKAKKEELRSLASQEISELFRLFVGSPYYEHVAIIAKLLSGLDTNADYVKKVAKRSSKQAAGDKVSRKRS
jgi:hypothetical protein